MAWLILAAVFLPLFPLSIVFNATLARVHHPLARLVFTLLWPQVGVAAMQMAGATVPPGFLLWALISSGLYALRLLTVRDLGIYVGFLASSALALTWGLGVTSTNWPELSLFVFWFSFPVALLGLFIGPLTRRFGAAYAGVCGGIGRSLPRLSTGLALVVVASIATPPFPSFFAQWQLLRGLNGAVALAVSVIWLIWSWAGTLLLRGFVFGPPRDVAVVDIDRGSAWSLWIVLVVFTFSGIYLMGVRT